MSGFRFVGGGEIGKTFLQLGSKQSIKGLLTTMAMPRKTSVKAAHLAKAVVALRTVPQKRLGDGFYEQQLLREQVAQLTGRRFIGNFTSDQQQYQALMDSGLTYAKAQNLRPGIALSAAQIALLTTDIAWLQQESVTSADGTVTQALVPHLYAVIRAGDLSPTGGLLSGDTVNLDATGEVRNGGTITAQNSLTAIAGRDLNVVSITQSSAGSAGKNVTLSAGRFKK